MTRNRESAMPDSRRGPAPYFEVLTLARARGANAVDHAARHHAARMTLPAGEAVRDYRDRAESLMESGIMLPDDAPSWALLLYGAAAFRSELFQAAETLFQDGAVTLFDDDAGLARCQPEAAERMAWACLSERLWTGIERAETLMNRQHRRAQLARVAVAALPRMVSLEAQVDLVRGFAREAFTRRGIVVDWTIHDRGDGNPHVFMMAPTRFLGEDAWGGKDRTGAGRAHVFRLRQAWERHVNLILEREDRRERIDMRSFRNQGIPLEPENHDRRIAANADRAGVPARQRLRCEEVRKRNQALLRETPEHIIMMVQAGRTAFTKHELLAALADRLDLTPETLPSELAAKVADSPDLMPTGETAPDGEPLFVTRARAKRERSRA